MICKLLEINDVKNNLIVQLIKRCAEIITCSLIQLDRKLYDLEILYTMWSSDTSQDYSEAVYEHVIKMFAANAFRPMPPAAYATSPLPPSTDTGSAVAPDLTMESAQSAAAYLAFGKFIDRQLFDPAKAEPHVDSRFVAALVHRWNSVDAAERTGAAETLYRLSDACRSVRAIAFAAVVHELADYAYGHASECRNGVDELFGFLIDVLHRVDSAPAAATVNQLSRVLIRLLRHPYLAEFQNKLVDCAQAVDQNRDTLIPKMLDFAVNNWSRDGSGTHILLHVAIKLYESCDHDAWIALRSRVIGRLVKLFGNDSFQLAELAMGFWQRLLSDPGPWPEKQDEARAVADALRKVEKTHWNSDCVAMAKSLSNIMVSMKLVDNDHLKDIEDTHPEQKSIEKDYDYLSKCILTSIKHSLNITNEN